MRYFLKNIAQDNMLRTILLIVLGVAMWVPSFFEQEYLIPKIVTLLITITNALLITQCFYRGRETNLPSPFIGSTYWLAMSAIPALHTIGDNGGAIGSLDITANRLPPRVHRRSIPIHTHMLFLRAITSSHPNRHPVDLGLPDLQRTDDLACVVCFAHCHCCTRDTYGSFPFLCWGIRAMADEHSASLFMSAAILHGCLPCDSIATPAATAQTIRRLRHHLSHTDHSTNRHGSIMARTITPL